MTEVQFNNFKNLIYDSFGTHITESKRDTLEIKINKILSKYHPNIKSIDEYYKILQEPKKYKEVWEIFVDNITVHKTYFFREHEHFDYVKNNIPKLMEEIPRIKARKEIRVWCAAASTGEEPYTIAMIMKENLPKDIKLKFLATDISEDVLRKAIRGVYTEEAVKQTPPELIRKYLKKEGDTYQVSNELKELVNFRKFNLTNPFIFKNTFDIVFCRNVMIYFDEPTKLDIIHKIYSNLEDNGIFIVGLSESLGNKYKDFRLLVSSIYKK